MSSTKKNILIIGGTGAQGLPVIRGLLSPSPSTGSPSPYTVTVLTRDPTSRRAQSLLSAFPDSLTLLKGSFTSESDVRLALSGCWGAFVNIDGFATGEALEIFYTMRCYELALEAGTVRLYVHGNLDYGYKNSGWDPEMRCGHYDGKGRAGRWILDRNKELLSSPGGGTTMRAALFTTGPYIEMSIASSTPMTPRVELERDSSSGGGDPALTWYLPLGRDGAVPHVALDDCAHYVRWLFDNPDRADGMDLAVAIGHIRYDEMAEAFTKVTGKKARFVDVNLDTYFNGSPYWKAVGSRPCGYTAGSADPPPGFMTVRENFRGFWNLWRASGGNRGPVKRDYELLDEIHPARIRTAEEYFRREDEKARKDGRGSLWDAVVAAKPVLKIHEDKELRARADGKL
ncbi:hypothetical protein QBC42DRAFT_327628 [Cladorrhinum samala]|uniref:NmrA-like domain-containing protein n=1 Tax=Cladorrhinum samala TaxID=585594 RepID=A0AAV9I125_9PEZI|nr:hypothetical protein QBC42DRAFT_327628 [Cladorrhinum samala]